MFAWPVGDPGLVERLAVAGVDGVISGDPEMVAARPGYTENAVTRGKRAGWSLLGAVLGAAPLAAVLLAFAAGPAAAAVPAKHGKAVKAATARPP